MHGVLGLRGQLFQERARDGGDRRFLVGQKAQFNQSAAQPVALARLEAQIAHLHQGRGQAVGGAEGDARLLGNFLDRAAAVGNGAHHVQAAKKRLAGERFGGFGGGGVGRVVHVWRGHGAVRRCAIIGTMPHALRS
ncbi:hypothetical protein SDC9_160054 [bioreactor metagenome]|uniref:Uncharacterized protein n=1 Tax=bioreactor metagenome TaxID=1076179 RepID=A0A645FJY2_9ZZZZ